MKQTETAKNTDMRRSSLNIRRIFRCMMEDGYYPSYEKTNILFEMDENIAVLEYEEDIVSIRLFFSIDEDAYDLFLEASNSTMSKSFMVKPVVLESMDTIMFSFEAPCRNLREFRRMIKVGIDSLRQTVDIHKSEMRRLILAEEMVTAMLPASEDSATATGRSIKHKMLS